MCNSHVSGDVGVFDVFIVTVTDVSCPVGHLVSSCLLLNFEVYLPFLLLVPFSS